MYVKYYRASSIHIISYVKVYNYRADSTWMVPNTIDPMED